VRPDFPAMTSIWRLLITLSCSISLFPPSPSLPPFIIYLPARTSKRQIDVIAGHVRAHEALLGALPGDERALIEQASATLREGSPVRPGRLRMPEAPEMTDNSAALRRSRRQDSRAKRERAAEALVAAEKEGEPISFPAVARRAGVSVSLLYADTALSSRIATAPRPPAPGGQRTGLAAPRALLVSEQTFAQSWPTPRTGPPVGPRSDPPSRTAQPPPSALVRTSPAARPSARSSNSWRNRNAELEAEEPPPRARISQLESDAR